jgi:hypothetical protein
MSAQTHHSGETIPGLLDRICRNSQIACVNDLFVSPLQKPEWSVWEDFRYLKTLALLFEATKGDVKTVRMVLKEQLSHHKHILKKMGDDVTEDLLWWVKGILERKRADDKSRKTNELAERKEALQRKAEAISASRGESKEGLHEEKVRTSNDYSGNETQGQENQSCSSGGPQRHKTPTSQGSRASGTPQEETRGHTGPETAPHPESHEPHEPRSVPLPHLWDSQDDIDYCKQDYRLPDIDPDPAGASAEDLLFLRQERDSLFKEKNEYYKAVRLKLHARYQRRLNRYEQQVLRTKINIRDRGSNTAPSPIRRNHDQSPDQREEECPRGSQQHHHASGAGSQDPNKRVDANNDDDMDGCISLLHFGYKFNGPTSL